MILLSLPHHQARQGDPHGERRAPLVARLRADAGLLQGERRQGTGHRRHEGRLHEGHGQGPAPGAAPDREGPLLHEGGRDQDQGGRRRLRARRLSARQSNVRPLCATCRQKEKETGT